MAHSQRKITERITFLDDVWTNHELSELNFAQSALVIDDGHHLAAVRDAKDHGTFHLRKMSGNKEHGYRSLQTDPHGYIYQPPHPSMTADDIEGATYAYDDGTHWHFAHCSPDEQVDFAAAVRVFVVAQFQVAIENARTKVTEATNAITKATALTKVKALVKFASTAGTLAFNEVVGETLGHYHRDPHHDHYRQLAVSAIDAVSSSWSKAAVASKAVRQDATLVGADVAGIRAELVDTHIIETRAARVMRLEAEKKAKEAAAETPAETRPGDGA